MPSYKLCYFNARGIAEVCRLLFAEAGIPFEDVRYSSDVWLKHKPDMLFNQLPVLFVDNEQIANSRAAIRFLAREFKLDGGDSLTTAKIDMWIEVIFEAFMKLPYLEKNEKKKAEQTAVVIEEAIIPKLKKLQELIKENKGNYAFGENPTALDFTVYSLLDILKRKVGNNLLESLPEIEKLMAAIEERPNIVKWIAERPNTAE